MKWIRYKVLDCEVNHGTEEEPIVEQFFSEKGMTWSEANEEIAKREAHNGEYTIEDDDLEEPTGAPTLEDRVGNLEADTADLAEALEQILDSGVA
jgi:hypothetical protein